MSFSSGYGLVIGIVIIIIIIILVIWLGSSSSNTDRNAAPIQLKDTQLETIQKQFPDLKINRHANLIASFDVLDEEGDLVEIIFIDGNKTYRTPACQTDESCNRQIQKMLLQSVSE